MAAAEINDFFILFFFLGYGSFVLVVLYVAQCLPLLFVVDCFIIVWVSN